MEFLVSSSSMHLQGEILSRKLAKLWREFVASKKTTLALAKDFKDLEINTETIKTMQFEQLASKIGTSATLQTAKSLLDRLQNHLTLFSFKSSCKDINHLLKRLASPKRKGDDKLTRYPVRVMLCAYMILGHPDAIFNRQGELERLLSESAPNMIREFELLIKMILDGSSFRAQLKIFDASWCSYLEQFVRWKVNDVKSLEEDLVSMACKMELSMMETCKLGAAGEESGVSLTHDREAVKEQVKSDQKILRDKVRQLSGKAGVERMETALSDTRSKYYEAKEKETSTIVLPGGNHTDNELLINEIIHEQSHGFSNRLGVGNEGVKDEFKVKIKETMEKAFWDDIEETLKRDEPDYGRVVELVKEVRDELCSIASSWKETISDSIDIDILSQVLITSGTHDLSYLKNILAYALTTLRKLSSPASESDMMKTHTKLMDELSDEKANPSLVIVKGLRFVLEGIQDLKKEINKAHIRMLEPVIQGPAGFDYLRKAFADCYGCPANAHSSLPVTVNWIQSVRSMVDQEWAEYTDSLTRSGLPHHTSLRSGRSSSVPVTTTTTHQPECNSGDKVNKMVRLGLLKLASEIQGFTQETIPETLKLNLSRLRNSQEQLQKIIVSSTSILVLRQTLVSEKLTATEYMVSRFVERLLDRLSRTEDVGIQDIVETMEESVGSENEKCSDARKEVMANMLVKSLRPDDPVFGLVSRSVYAATRAIVFGGSSLQGREISERELRKLGASLLTDKLVEVVEVLIVLATVSSNVHRPWYVEITESS
ncbi:hypothetical protein ACHQM5_006036 [Ranunculus cassubicifolius]